jgi:hypothetical protein
MNGCGTGIRQGCSRHVEGRLSSELRLPCFTSLSRRFNVMTALRRSSPGAQLPGAVLLVAAQRSPTRQLARCSREAECNSGSST